MEEKIQKALTGRAFAIGLVLSVLWTVWAGVGYFYAPMSPLFYFRMSETFIAFAAVLVFPAIAVALLPRRLKLSNAELVLIYSMMTMVVLTTVQVGLYTVPASSLFPLPQYEWTLENISPYLGPLDQTVIENMIQGGVPVPWNSWATPLAWWMFSVISFQIFSIFVATLLSRQYVRVEELSFPLANAAKEVINMSTETEGRPGLFRSKEFWIAAVISFVFGLAYARDRLRWGAPTLNALLSWIPVSELDLTPLAQHPAGPLVFNLFPWLIGFGYLVRNDILITTSASFVIGWLIVPIMMVTAGLIPPMDPGRNYYYEFLIRLKWALGNQEVYRWGYEPFVYGLMVAVVVYTTWRGRGLLAESFKALFSNVPEETEQHEPMSYRSQWIGTIVFAALWVISLVIIDIPVQYAILSLLIVTVIYVSISRVRAESGGALGGCMHSGQLPHNLYMTIAHSTGLTASPRATISFISNGVFYGLNATTKSICQSVSMPFVLENYRLAYLTGARGRDIFTGQVVASIIAVILPLPLTLWHYYENSGYSRLLGRGALGTGRQLTQTAYYRIMDIRAIGQNDLPNEFTLGLFTTGFLLAIVLYLARAKWSGFVFTPIGVILAWWEGFWLWFPFAIALILKILTIRLGGSKLYSEKGVPAATGSIVGVALCLVVTGVSWFILGEAP